MAKNSKSETISKLLGNVPNMSRALLLVIGTIAAYVSDIAVVGSISGAIFGSSMMFILPPIVYLKAIRGKWQAFPAVERPLTYRVKIISNVLLLIAGLSFTCVSAKEVIGMLLMK